jgi:MoaA/NifB/PqqE/SkfB family radical SAM enzyme
MNNHTPYHEQRIIQTDKIYNSENLLPHRYVFILTNKCNLRCSFCFQDKKFIEGSLNLDGWINIIKQLPDYAHVTLTGGEPFLFDSFKEVFLEVTKKHTCNIISNGLLLNDDLIDLLLSEKNFQVLSISIDNIGNTVREVDENKWKIAEELFKKFIKKRDLLYSKAILDMKTVVLDQNSKQLFNIYKYCTETLQADTHSFMFLKGSPIQHSDTMYDFDEIFNESQAHKYINFNEIINQLEKVRIYNLKHQKKSYSHPNFVDLNGDQSLLNFDFNFMNQINHKVENFKPCKAPWGSVHINVEGNLFPCLAISMGNVKKSTLNEIFFGEKFTKFKDTIKNCGSVEGCNRCGYLIPKDELVHKLIN